MVTVENVKFVQFSTSKGKIVDYDKDLDEGVFMRYIARIDLSKFNFSVELDPRKTELYIIQDLKCEVLDEDDVTIKKLAYKEIAESWSKILHEYPMTEDDRIKFLNGITGCGDLIYGALMLFWQNTPKEIKDDIKEKNKVKFLEEEICLNDVLDKKKGE